MIFKRNLDFKGLSQCLHVRRGMISLFVAMHPEKLPVAGSVGNFLTIFIS